MHEGEVETDSALVGRLLARQFPQWTGLPISLVESYGTDHDIYRLGDELAVRLPRIDWAADQASLEAEWLPRLAPHVPLALPVQLALGRPDEGYPFAWGAYEWLPGQNANGTIQDLEQAAVDLAGFVTALRKVDPTGAHPRQPGSRGSPLMDLDEPVRRQVHELDGRIDGPKVLRLWEESLSAPVWKGPEQLVHGDLLPGNLLVIDGRLSAVIDFGGLNVGDPACDVQPAWHTFADTSRALFLEELRVDDASRLRGRGWVIYQTVSALAYYWDTNPGMVRMSTHALRQVVEESRTR